MILCTYCDERAVMEVQSKGLPWIGSPSKVHYCHPHLLRYYLALDMDWRA